MSAAINFNTDVSGDMIFLEKDVQLSDTIIGKGAFGEVRIARWRNIDVAAKRLHPLVLEKEISQINGSEEIDLNHCAVVDSFHVEMETLSKLRHPNLVLFLGIACNPKTRQPTTILTELMPGSVYDILEVHKIKLLLPDVLDIAIDVCCGLEYLHCHDPQIVHRDISAKNILIGGNRAKIADLGQAKLFGSSALSRQTSMPGAMAYSAPEVLTGRYTAKIDIFSFGILLIQMCTGQYPRIDRREDQLKAACQKYLPLATLLTNSVSFQPTDRPTSTEMSEILKEIRQNDRYYPPVRRQSPQCDIGVMARRYIEESVEQRCGDIRLALEQTARRLTVEEQRWRDEAARVDGIKQTADDNAAQLVACQDALSRQRIENEKLEKKIDDANSRIYEIEEASDALKADKAQLEGALRVQRQSHEDTQREFDQLQEKYDQISTQNDSVQERVSAAKNEASYAMSREQNLKRQNHMQAEEIKELEQRLEQALMRWKQEKALVVSEGERCARLRDSCADMIERAAKSTSEIERLTRRLHLYDTLPMPDEIKARFRDYEDDSQRSKAEISDLMDKRKELKGELGRVTELLSTTQTSLAETDSERLRLDQDGQQMKRQISDLTDALAALSQQFDNSQTLVSMLEAEKQSLLDISEKLRKQVSLKDDELSAMRTARRKERKNKKRNSKLVDVSTTDVSSHVTYDNEDNQYDDDDNGFEDEVDPDAEENGTTEKSNVEPSKNTLTVLPKFGGGAANGIMALVKAAVETRASQEMLDSTVAENSQNDLLERKRKMDAAAKMRVLAASEHGGAVNVIKVVYENLHCENTCWRGARTLRDLFMQDEAVKAKCLEAKCDELMLAGLTAFPNSAIVQSQCLRGLAALCFGSDIVRRHCGENGAMKRIVISLETHSDDASVVHHACTALTNLTHNNIDNRMRFQEAGGIEAISFAFSQHWKDSKITRQACWAILTLAGTDELSREIVECGGAKVISEAMNFHCHDAGVQQFGSWAISNLALAGDDIRLRIRKLGIVEICRMALENHGDDMEVVRQCRHALGVLGPDSDGGKRGGIGGATRTDELPAVQTHALLDNSLRPGTSGSRNIKRLTTSSHSQSVGKLPVAASSPQGKNRRISGAPGKK